METEAKTPLLSVCMAGRNDNYGCDFLRRFEQAANFLAYGAAKTGLADGRIEIVFVDWNSPTPLADAVKLSPAAKSLVKFIEVPPALAKRVCKSERNFHSALSMNVAFRRARGRYVGFMPSDILISPGSLLRLVALLEGKASPPPSFQPEKSVLGVPRKFIPERCRDSELFSTNELIEKTLEANDLFLSYEAPMRGLGGGYGIFLLPKELAVSLQGADENLDGWGLTDIDLAYRAALAGFPFANLSAFGINSYDFTPTRNAACQKAGRACSLPFQIKTRPNGADWGLAKEELKISRASQRESSKPATPNTDRKLDPDDVAETLFAASKSIPLRHLSGFSPAALLLATLAMRQAPRQYLDLGGTDLSCLAALSIVSACSDVILLSGQGTPLSFMADAEFLLQDCRHAGTTAFMPLESRFREPETLANFTSAKNMDVGLARVDMNAIGVELDEALVFFGWMLARAPECSILFVLPLDRAKRDVALSALDKWNKAIGRKLQRFDKFHFTVSMPQFHPELPEPRPPLLAPTALFRLLTLVDAALERAQPALRLLARGGFKALTASAKLITKGRG